MSENVICTGCDRASRARLDCPGCMYNSCSSSRADEQCGFHTRHRDQYVSGNRDAVLCRLGRAGYCSGPNFVIASACAILQRPQFWTASLQIGFQPRSVLFKIGESC